MLMTASELLKASLEIYRKQFWLFVGYAAWLLVPFAAFVILLSAPDHPAILGVAILTGLAQLFVGLWVTITIILLAKQLSDAQPLDPAQTSKKAVMGIQNLLATIFLQVLIVLGGFLLLVIPGIIFAIWYGLAQTAAVLDGKRPIDALSTSRSLVRGRFAAVAWRMISAPLVMWLIYSLIVGGTIYLIAGLAGVDPVSILSEEVPIWAQILEAVGEIFLIPLALIYSTLLYLDLKNHPLEAPEKVA